LPITIKYTKTLPKNIRKANPRKSALRSCFAFFKYLKIHQSIHRPTGKNPVFQPAQKINKPSQQKCNYYLRAVPSIINHIMHNPDKPSSCPYRAMIICDGT